MTRRWYIDQALQSYARLNEVLGDLTEAEVMVCLDLESAGRRRRSITDRLISRAVRINEIAFNNSLQEKYHGQNPKQNHDSRRKEGRSGNHQG